MVKTLTPSIPTTMLLDKAPVHGCCSLLIMPTLQAKRSSGMVQSGGGVRAQPTAPVQQKLQSVVHGADQVHNADAPVSFSTYTITGYTFIGQNVYLTEDCGFPDRLAQLVLNNQQWKSARVWTVQYHVVGALHLTSSFPATA